VVAPTRATRVLHIMTRYRRGGSEQRLRDIVDALADCEHRVILGEDSDLDLARAQLHAPVEHEPDLVRAPSPVADLRTTLRLVRRMRGDRPDVVITHQSKAGALGRLAARVAGRVPVVHSLSMANFGPGFGGVESVAFRWVERALAPVTSRYVVVGADLARRFEVAGVAAAKLVIVRSAAALPGPRPDERPAVPGVPDDRPVIVSLGALEDRKNPLDLVPLLARVRRSVPDAFLAVAGEGPRAEDLAAAAAGAGFGDDVALLGYVKPVEPLLWRADALVLLSDAEGLPQVLIQSAAAGTPFVTYDVDGGREVVALGASGTVVPPGDVAAAADATVELLRTRQGETRAVDLSSWDSEAIHAGYRRVIGGVVEEARRAG
jgi:glycosyltransferase involved in cell wall biosynthesis